MNIQGHLSTATAYLLIAKEKSSRNDIVGARASLARASGHTAYALDHLEKFEVEQANIKLSKR